MPTWQPRVAENVGEETVADHSPPDDPVVLLLSPGDQTSQEEGEAIRPGQEAVLLPPPLHHQRDVEAEEEGEGHPSVDLAAPPGKLLKYQLLSISQGQPAKQRAVLFSNQEIWHLSGDFGGKDFPFLCLSSPLIRIYTYTHPAIGTLGK